MQTKVPGLGPTLYVPERRVLEHSAHLSAHEHPSAPAVSHHSTHNYVPNEGVTLLEAAPVEELSIHQVALDQVDMVFTNHTGAA